MNIIAIRTIVGSKQTLIYNLTLNTIYTYIPSIRQQDFYDFCKSKTFLGEYVIIGFNQPYRNTLYALYPNIKICIDKDEVEKLFMQMEQMNRLLLDEIAITLEKGSGSGYIANRVFVQAFYQNQDKENAREVYKEWVSQIPLGIPEFYRLVRVMEFYMDEILNYFEIINEIN